MVFVCNFDIKSPQIFYDRRHFNLHRFSMVIFYHSKSTAFFSINWLFSSASCYLKSLRFINFIQWIYTLSIHLADFRFFNWIKETQRKRHSHFESSIYVTIELLFVHSLIFQQFDMMFCCLLRRMLEDNFLFDHWHKGETLHQLAQMNKLLIMGKMLSQHRHHCHYIWMMFLFLYPIDYYQLHSHNARHSTAIFFGLRTLKEMSRYNKIVKMCCFASHSYQCD